MKKALKLAKHALDRGEFPVGCVLVYNGKVIAQGEREGTSRGVPNEVDHAEILALRHLAKGENTLENRKDMVLFCTMEPCLMCFAAILLSGIGTIVYAFEDVMGGGTRCALENMPPLYADATIKIVPDVLRSESLSLFRSYFKNPGNEYWKGSLLYRYTLQS